MKLIFEVRDAEEGGYCACAVGHAIFTQGDSWEELHRNALEAAALHFADSPNQPQMVELHYQRSLGSAEVPR